VLADNAECAIDPDALGVWPGDAAVPADRIFLMAEPIAMPVADGTEVLSVASKNLAISADLAADVSVSAVTPARIRLRASVVVCVYTEKRLPQIRAALDSIARQTMPPSQVIVVADHNPALRDLLAAEYPDHEVISNKFESGLSGARNTGIEQAAGDIVAFLDDDARAEPQWLEILLACYDDESVLGVGGLVLADWGPSGRPAWLPEEFLWVVGCSYRGQPEIKAEVRNPIGANMSFLRSAFDRAGLFDSSVGRTFTSARPLGCEETEFSIRLRRLSPGARIIYEPLAVVYHHIDQSRGTWPYFLSRCRAEGCSKARVSRLSGASAALSTERSYVTHTILRAMRRELSGGFRRGGKESLRRLAALSLGTLSATAGYVREMAPQHASRFGKGKY
jgi:GT2 family glycosyltransferase